MESSDTEKMNVRLDSTDSETRNSERRKKENCVGERREDRTGEELEINERTCFA